MPDVRRRELIALLGGAAAWPLAARAQQPVMLVVGILYAGSSAGVSPTYMAAFRKGLEEAGFAEGQNVAFDFRFAENNCEVLPEIAADMVRNHVAADPARLSHDGSGLALGAGRKGRHD
jgi:putative ABC transport system substrate-binding protein